MTEQPTYFTIRQWSIHDRPREKMQQNGAQHLSDAELLALLIGSGHKGESAVHLMQRLLSSVDNNILELHAIALEKMMEWKGIGLAKAVKIKAALELGKRMHLAAPVARLQCDSSAKAFQLFQPVLSFLAHEEFWVAYLNHQNKLLLRYCLSKGGIASTTVDLRLLLKKALEVGATGLLIAHNHPTGNLQPSKADLVLTEKIKTAAEAIDIQLLDHLIVSENGYFSFADENTL